MFRILSKLKGENESPPQKKTNQYVTEIGKSETGTD